MSENIAGHEELLDKFKEIHHDLETFMHGVVRFIGTHPDLIKQGSEIVHSYKARIKDYEHLRDKISRKIKDGREITVENLFSEVTDLAGVRILHLFQEHFENIDAVIRKRIAVGDWVLAEKAKAYTWDPEAAEFFGKFDLEVKYKPTSYTSVHYLLRPKTGSPICCEVQVRTLFEEIWGEVDHRINYPVPTEDLACKEQIKVLSKIVGAGSRLLDSINRVHQARK